MSDSAQASPESAQVGRYRIERLIARGGMGSVYLARHMDLHRSVALKVLTPGRQLDDDGRFEDRFRLEAETLASLKHDNIVTLFDYEKTAEGCFYLALEYIDGPRFTDLLRQGPLEPAHAVRLILQVLRALRYAHKKGVVHRDLKPSNLLIEIDDEGEERVKVVDFGLVKVLEDDQSLTRAGLILGSPHCMSPEQIRGDEVDHRTDIYAIGVLLFRSMTGEWPFHGDTSTATMIAHINNPVPRFASVAPHGAVPSALESIVRRCLAKSPAQRPSDAHLLMQELKLAMGAGASRSTSTDVAQPTEPHTLGGGEATRLAGLPRAHSAGASPVRPFVVGAVVALLLGGLVFAAWSAGRQGAQLPFPGVQAPAPSADASHPATGPAASRPTPVVTPVPAGSPVEPGAAALETPARPPAERTVVRKASVTTSAPEPDPMADDDRVPADGAEQTEAPDGYMGLPGEF